MVVNDSISSSNVRMCSLSKAALQGGHFFLLPFEEEEEDDLADFSMESISSMDTYDQYKVSFIK